MLIYIFNRPGWANECTEVESLARIEEYLKEGYSVKYPTDAERLDSLINSLLGTCDSLSDEDSDWLDEVRVLHLFDEAIFLCEDCGWWCDISETTESEIPNGHICQDCGEGYEED